MELTLILIVSICCIYIMCWLIYLLYNILHCEHTYYFYGTRRDFRYIGGYYTYCKYTYYQFICKKCNSIKEIPSFELMDKYNEIIEQTKIDKFLGKIDNDKYKNFEIKIENIFYNGYSCFKLYEFYLNQGIDLLEINKV